jgi:hypothetical protein
MIDQAAHNPQDRSLEQQGHNELCQGNLSVLRIGGVLIIEQVPETLERLLADETGDDSPDDAERDKQNLDHISGCLPFILRVSRGSLTGSRVTGPPGINSPAALDLGGEPVPSSPEFGDSWPHWNAITAANGCWVLLQEEKLASCYAPTVPGD